MNPNIPQGYAGATDPGNSGGGNATRSSGQPNLLERLLPTAGSIAGGIIGVPLNALDAVTGVGGTALDAGAAAAGGAAGKALENLFTHQGIASGVGTSALEGGIGQAGGEAIGGALNGFGGLLSKVGENTATKAEEGVAQDALENKAAATKLNYGAIPQKVASLSKLGENQKFVDSMGFDSSDPYQMKQVANAGFDLNGAIDKSLQNINIDTSGATNPAYKLAQEGKLGTPEANSLLRAYTNANIPVGPDGSIPNQLPATSVRQLTQSLGSEMGDKDYQIAQIERSGSGADTTQLKANRAQLQSIRDDLVNKLNSSPEVNANIKASEITPDEQAVLAQKYGEPLSKHIANTVNGAQSYSDIIPEMQKFAQMGNLSNKAIDDIENVTNTDRALGRIKLAGAADRPAPSSPGIHDLANAAAHTVQGNHGSALASLFKGAMKGGGAIAPKAGGLLQRVSKFVPPVAQVVANSPNDITQPQQGGNNMSPTSMGGAGGQSDTTANITAATSPLLQLVQQLMGNMQTAQADPLRATSPAAMTSSTSALQALIPTLQKASVANATLQALEQEFGQAGGGQGAAPGLLNEIGQTFTGGPASLTSSSGYNAQANQLNQQLQSLGISTPLPSLTQNAPAAAGSMNTLQSILNAIGGNSGGLLGTVPTAATP
jgi:hypothetical protein